MRRAALLFNENICFFFFDTTSFVAQSLYICGIQECCYEKYCVTYKVSAYNKQVADGERGLCNCSGVVTVCK